MSRQQTAFFIYSQLIHFYGVLRFIKGYLCQNLKIKI